MVAVFLASGGDLLLSAIKEKSVMLGCRHRTASVSQDPDRRVFWSGLKQTGGQKRQVFDNCN